MNNIQRADVTLLHVLWMAKLQFATDRIYGHVVGNAQREAVEKYAERIEKYSMQ